MVNKKSQVIEEIFKICITRKNFEFHNDLVKEVSKLVEFGNPFDVTKLDNKTKLPDILVKKDYAIIHLGSGKHKFIKGINKVYHEFEPIQKYIDWEYKKSLLNQYNTSESNITQAKAIYFLLLTTREFYIIFYLEKMLNLMMLIF